MSSVKKTNKNSKQTNPLLFVAIAVAVIAVALVIIDPAKDKTDDTIKTEVSVASNDAVEGLASKQNERIPATLNDNGDVVIQLADISETATFYDLEVNGSPMGLFAVKASDGTIRTAFDTCQVCNGSPYAYFEQQEDTFQCQNCGNIYSVDMIEQERGGCNPVPITADEKTVTDTEITIPASLLEDNVIRFDNWKVF